MASRTSVAAGAPGLQKPAIRSEVTPCTADQTVNERALVAEVVVDGGRRHSGTRTQLADREALLAAAREQRLGCGQDRAPGRPGPTVALAERSCRAHGASIAPL